MKFPNNDVLPVQPNSVAPVQNAREREKEWACAVHTVLHEYIWCFLGKSQSLLLFARNNQDLIDLIV